MFPSIQKRVPRETIELAARKIASIKLNVVEKNDHTSWCRHLHFASHCFKLPLRGGKRWNPVSAVNNLVRGEADVVAISGSLNHRSKRQISKKSLDPLELLPSMVA